MKTPLLLIASLSAFTLAAQEAPHVEAPVKPDGQAGLEIKTEADEQQDRVSNLEAMLDSAQELHDEPAILESARQLLECDPSNIDALEASVAVQLQRKDALQARQLSERFVKSWPGKPESHLAYADACACRLAGETPQQAAALIAKHLAEAKKLSDPAKDFDRQEELAEAYDKAGEHAPARRAYLDLAAMTSTTPASHKEAIARADEIADNFTRHGVITLSSLFEKEGTLTGLDTELYAGVWDGWLVGLHTHADWLSSGSEISRFGRDERQEALLTGRHIWGAGWQLDAQAGVALNGDTLPVGGLILKKTFDSDAIIKAGLYGNERAGDSQLLVREGGRQQRAVVEAEIPLSKKVEFQTSAQLRKIDTDDGSLGWGESTNQSIEWRPFTSFPGLSLGYEWEFSRFHFNEDFNRLGPGGPRRSDFVYRQTNTHLGVLDVKHSFGDLTVDLRLAGGYAISQHRDEYDPALTLDYRLSNNCRMFLIYEYDSASGKRVSSGDANTLSWVLNMSF